MTCPYSSVGWTLGYDADGVNPYTTIDGIVSASGPGLSVELKTTDDVGDAWVERCAGKKDGGTTTAQVKMSSSTYDLFVNTLFGEVYYYKETFPLGDGESTAATNVWQGIMDQVGLEVPEGDGTLMVPIQITATGAVTFTPAS